MATTPTQEQQPAAPTTPDNTDFDTAFGEAIGDDVVPADPPAEDPPAEDPPKDPPAEDPPKDPPPRKVADYTAEELAELLHKPKEEPKPEAEPPKEPTIDDFLSDEDREVLKAYEGDWKEVSQAESIRRRAEGQLLRQQIINEVAASLAPIAKHIQQSQVSGHFEKIQAAHPGYEKFLPDVQKWVGTQPAIIQQQLNTVLEKGSSEQVIELFDLYTKNSKTGAAPAPPASSDTPPVDTAAKKAAEQQRQKAAAATAAVSSRRDTKMGAKDDDDFDAAFDEAVSQS